MNLSRHLNILMASVVSTALAATPLAGVSIAHAQNAPAAEAPGDAGWQKEFETWRSASKGGTASGYEAYLRAYPTGKFASVAKKRIDELNVGKTADAATVDGQKTADVVDSAATETQANDTADAEADKKRDLEMWRQVSKTGTQADYEKYLKAFPKGKFAKVAKTRVAGLIAAAAAADGNTADVVEAPVTTDNQQAAVDAQEQGANDETAQASEQVPDDTQTTVQADAAQPQDEAQAPANGDWEQEYALWKAASDGNTVVEYEAYLSAYPKGKFATIAQARIVQLAAAEQPVADVAEGDANAQDDQANKTSGNVQPDDQQDMASNAADEQPQQDDMGQNTAKDRPAVQFTEGTPEIEDQILDRETRHELQGRLTALGYDTAGTDGAFGPRSRNAIAGWQQDNGAPVSGYLSGDQVDAIRKTSEVAYADWLAAQPVAVETVRPRREKVVVIEEERNPGVDALIAAGVIGAVVGAHKFKRAGKFRARPGSVKLIGKFKVRNCKKKRRC
jgi:hypothetical protein